MQHWCTMSSDDSEQKDLAAVARAMIPFLEAVAKRYFRDLAWEIATESVDAAISINFGRYAVDADSLKPYLTNAVNWRCRDELRRLPCEHELQLLSTVQRSSMRLQGSLKDASVGYESATSIAHRQTRRVRRVEDQAQSSASSWPNSPWSSLFIPYRFLVEIRQFAGAFQPGPVRAQLARCQLFRDLQLYVPMVWRTSACWARLLALLKYRRVAIRHLRRWPRGQTPQSGVRYRWCHPSGLRRDCAMRLPPAPRPPHQWFL